MTKYAIIGYDPWLLPLIDHVRRSCPSASWTVAYDVPQAHRVALETRCGPLSFVDNWEVLTLETDETTVLVSSWPEDEEGRARRGEQLRRLAASAVSLIAVHPPCDLLMAYELWVARQQRASWRVYHPALLQPAFHSLRHSIIRDTGAEPSVRGQLAIEWERPRCAPGILRRDLARDLFLLWMLCGPIEKAAGWGGALDGSSWDLALQLQTASGILLRWSLAPADHTRSRWTWMAGPFRATLLYEASSGTWQEPGQEPPAASPLVDQEQFAAGVHSLVSTNSDYTENVQTNTVDARVGSAEWSEFCQAEETMEAVRQAVARQKVVQVRGPSPSEETAFKGFMAAGSCLVLLFLFLFLLVGSILEGFRYPSAVARWRAEQRVAEESGRPVGQPPSAARPLWWRLWPVYPLLLFLLLQGLWLLVRPNQPTERRKLPALNEDGPPPPRATER